MPYTGIRASTARRLGSEPDSAFPMYVLPVDVVLGLKRLPKHEDIKPKLLERRDGMQVLFVSHTWLKLSHPDDDANSKLLLLQRFLRDASALARHADTHWGVEYNYGNSVRVSRKQLAKISFVWFDVFSIPQGNRDTQARAIASSVDLAAPFHLPKSPL